MNGSWNGRCNLVKFRLFADYLNQMIRWFYSYILEWNCPAQQGNGIIVAGCAVYHMDNNGAAIWPQEMRLHVCSSNLLLYISSRCCEEGTVVCVCVWGGWGGGRQHPMIAVIKQTSFNCFLPVVLLLFRTKVGQGDNFTNTPWHFCGVSAGAVML